MGHSENMVSLFGRPAPALSQKHLLDIASLSRHDIETILRRAKVHKRRLSDGTVHRKLLDGKVIATLFVENSTRTRVSFEMAALRLGATLINWDEKTSSAQKGETFSDTIKYIAGYQPDAIIIRHSEYGAPQVVSKLVDCPVINAGDSYREHPTQALLDAMTMLEYKRSLEGLTVAICGDVAHSRVANSNMALLEKMGARVHLIAPPTLQPQKMPYMNVTQYDNLEAGLRGCDVVMMLRLQKERMEAALMPDDGTYFNQYGLTMDRLKLAKPDAIIMHPGPMNRNVEIADEVADDLKQSVIFQQGANGVPLRMAVLDLFLS